jgi:hypothetical protein
MRIVAVSLELILLITSWPVGGEFSRLHENASLYRPLSVVRLLTLSYGRDWMPPVWALHGIFWICLTAGVMALIGLWTNRSLILFAFGCIFVHGFQYSFGHFHHPDAILMFSLVVLAVSPCGGVLSVDASRSGDSVILDLEKKSPYSTWPILFSQWMFVLIYASAGYCKMRHGLTWLNGYTLQWYLVHDALAWNRPVAMWLAQQHEMALLLSWAAVLFEATFIAVMFFPQLRWLYLPFGLGFHGAIYLLMGAPFFEFMGLYAVFVPWTTFVARFRAAVERQVPAVSRPHTSAVGYYQRKRPI